MAATYGTSLKVVVNHAAENNSDSVSLTRDQVESGQNNFPSLIITDGDSVSLSGGQVDWILHGTATIGAGNTATLDLTALKDLATNTVIAKSYINGFLVIIESWDGTKKIQLGQFGTSTNVPFGESGVNNTTERTRFFLYENDNQEAANLGNAILIKNSSTVTLTVDYAGYGNRF